jgi:hypothetical protein
MFHYSDLIAAAHPAPWTPPAGDPMGALLGRYRRRSLPTRPDDAPRLNLPDAKYLDPLTTAALDVEADPVLSVTVMATCLESPVLAYASAPSPDGSRHWYRLAMLSDSGTAGLLVVHGTPSRRRVILHAVTLRLADLNDASAIRNMIEEVHAHGDRPERDVRDRGRTRAPRAVWLGLPDTGLPDNFVRRLAAIAAVDGYVLEAIGAVREHTRPALARTADLAPELVLLWAPYLPPGDFRARVQSLVVQAVVEVVDDPTPAEALDQARIWSTCVPVVRRAAAPDAGPATLSEAAKTAKAELQHIVITEQAIKRAAHSPFETPGDVMSNLRILDEIVALHGLGGPNFEQACADRGLLFSRDISSTARQKHGVSYMVDWEGEARMMGPHLRFGGSWDPRFCARVYWWTDQDGGRLVVGHIGVHLPGGDD